MIAIKRAYNPPSRADGTRVLVDRLWRHGVQKETVHVEKWMHEFGPSDELWQFVGHDPGRWQEFRKRYLAELKRPEAAALLAGAQLIAALPSSSCCRARSLPCRVPCCRGIHFRVDGKIAKTHRGVRSEFVRLSRAEPRIGRDLVTFLATAYQFNTRADYAVGSTATTITPAEATAAIATAKRFIDTITQLLPPGV